MSISSKGSASRVLIPIEGGVTAPQGFRAAGVHAGIKRKRRDLCLLVSDVPAAVAGTFTTNRVKAAPLLVTMEHVERGPVRALVANSGNANACNGPQGLEDARRMASLVAERIGVESHEVLVASTGVIGQPLPMDRIEAGIDDVWKRLDANGWIDASEAIMTTDTRPKNRAMEFRIGGRTVRLGGMAKGSGMIHPNMATMLAFLTTDAAIEPSFLKKAVQKAVAHSFNMISVDGDTSTNDMVLLMANGAAGNTPLRVDDPDAPLFEEALLSICIQLAKEIVKDGEGATKVVEVRVTGAASEGDARKVARTVTTSNLVKTAIYGEDANWGRILCAVGYSGAEIQPSSIHIFLDELQVAKAGSALPFDEERASEILREPEVRITIDLGQGPYEATAWTCDLTYEYVKINASYRT